MPCVLRAVVGAGVGVLDICPQQICRGQTGGPCTVGACDGRGVHHRTREAPMSTAPPTVRPFDDDLSTRLLHQRIVVLGQEVDDADRQPRLRPAAAAVRRGPAPRHRALHQLARAARSARRSPCTTRCGSSRTTSSTLAMGLAASAAQFLLSAGTPGQAVRAAALAGAHAPAVRRHRRHRDRHRDPGAEHGPREADHAVADRRAHRPDRRDDRARRRPRPLVHRRGGAGVRVHRPRRRAPRRRAARTRRCDGRACDGRPVHDPGGHRAAADRRARVRRLLAAAHRPDHLPRAPRSTTASPTW